MRRHALLLSLTLLIAAPAAAARWRPFSHAGRWITDASGRVVIVHGTNMVYKLRPYLPAAIGFGADDATFLARIGFNAVRIGVIWKAVEPRPGVYDDGYLRGIARTVNLLRRHGIMSLLDFHQDLYNERFQGEGAPDWAVQTGGRPNPSLGFPGNYLGNPALQHALDAFFSDARGPGGIGLQERFAAAWAHVAARFARTPGVLGYELLNEPFPGSGWQSCVNTLGCPFDQKLTILYRRARAAIRRADRHTLIFYEPNVLFNNGAGSEVGSLGDGDGGFAFHDYCLQEPNTHSPSGCDTPDNLVFSHALAHVATTHEALIETEWGSTTDVPYLLAMVARADRDMVPWTEWSYCACRSPTDTGQPGIVADPRRPPRGTNLISGTLGALVEPYPQLIAGTPLAWSFDRSARRFTVRYRTARVAGRGSFPAGALSQIFVPVLAYGRGYRVHVSGGRVASTRSAALLLVAAGRGARTVTVTVSPR